MIVCAWELVCGAAGLSCPQAFSILLGYIYSGRMNLLDIQTKEWNTDLLAAAGDNLAEKLGAPVSPNTVVGTVSEYMQERSVENQFQLSHRLTAMTGYG